MAGSDEALHMRSLGNCYILLRPAGAMPCASLDLLDTLDPGVPSDISESFHRNVLMSALGFDD